MTAKVRSRVTDGLTLKIEKNVKITEIDHNGACRRICEYFKTLFVPFLIDLSSDSSQKKYFKVSEKWRLFCFVLFCLGHFNVVRSSSVRLSDQHVQHHYDGRNDRNYDRNDRNDNALKCPIMK